ncbi:MAG: hypothetical protein SPI30_00260 [Prevotella sp.]|nr:hypothetical protein [Prevotella sp.]
MASRQIVISRKHNGLHRGENGRQDADKQVKAAGKQHYEPGTET